MLRRVYRCKKWQASRQRWCRYMPVKLRSDWKKVWNRKTESHCFKASRDLLFWLRKTLARGTPSLRVSRYAPRKAFPSHNVIEQYSDVIMSTVASPKYYQPHDCIRNRLFRRRSKKTSKLRVTGLCEGNSPVAGEFPAQRTSNAENVSICWRHHG